MVVQGFAKKSCWLLVDIAYVLWMFVCCGVVDFCL